MSRVLLADPFQAPPGTRESRVGGDEEWSAGGVRSPDAERHGEVVAFARERLEDQAAELLVDPLRHVALASRVFGVNDPQALIIAVLRVVIECTDTSLEELFDRFGSEAVGNAVLLSRPGLGSDQFRERSQSRPLRSASGLVRVLRLTELLDAAVKADHAQEVGWILSEAERFRDAIKSKQGQERRDDWVVRGAVQTVIEVADLGLTRQHHNREMKDGR